MRSHRVHSLRDLVRSSEFLTWHKKHSEISEELHGLEDKREKLDLDLTIAKFRADSLQNFADETLFKAGDYEDQSARSEAKYAEIENDSFQLLSDFEDKSRDEEQARIELHGIEKVLEDRRQDASERRATLEAKSGRESAQSDSKLRELGDEIASLGKQADVARGKFDEQTKLREELWNQVEETWSNAFKANMARSEFSYQGRRIHSKAESYFAQADEIRKEVSTISDKISKTDERLGSVRADRTRHLDDAKKNFDCTVVDEFLFWPNTDDVHAALCIPLIDEQSHFNIQIKALKVYQIERDKGLDFIEPVPDEELNDEDPRLNSFFIEGRAA